MKIYVVCDLEGTAGVVDFKLQCMEEERFYKQAIRLATMELNALVEGSIEGGATEVYAWPGHGAFPGGIDVEFLHAECRLVMHAGDAGPVGFDRSFDAMLQCGLHAMAGAENGVLSHSFTPTLENVWLNGTRIGEIGMNMAAFGEVDVPSVFISGDQAAVDEEVPCTGHRGGRGQVGAGGEGEDGGPLGEEGDIAIADESAEGDQRGGGEGDAQDRQRRALQAESTLHDEGPVH